MSGHGLSRQTVERIQDVLAHHPEVAKAVLFGSRAKGTALPGSDIDLALYGEGLDLRLLGRIEDEAGPSFVSYSCLARPARLALRAASAGSPARPSAPVVVWFVDYLFDMV